MNGVRYIPFVIICNEAMIPKKNEVVRYMFFKKHTGNLFPTNPQTSFEINLNGGKEEDSKEDKIEEMTRDRTIFLMNIPFFFTKTDIQNFFEKVLAIGTVKEIRIGSLMDSQEKKLQDYGYSGFSEVVPKPFVSCGAAHVLFEDEDVMDNLFQLSFNKPFRIQWPPIVVLDDHKTNDVKIGGLEGHLEEVLTQEIQDVKRLNLWLKKYDEAIAKQEELVEILKNQPDPDGFIKVLPTKGKKIAKPIKYDEYLQRQQHHLQQQEQQKKKKKISITNPSMVFSVSQQNSQVLGDESSSISGTSSMKNNGNMIDIDDQLLLKRNKKDFDIALYRFQRLEKKQEKLQNLRSQFEKDKLKIRKMKENRKFKPN